MAALSTKATMKLDKITNILNSFLEPFECEAFAAGDFAYYSGSNTISYALLIADTHEKSFMNFTRDFFPAINADPFLWSFLHELGHHETEDEFEEEDFEDYMRINQNEISSEEYYTLPIEFAATQWAAEFMTDHTKEVETLWNKLKPEIKDFFTEAFAS